MDRFAWSLLASIIKSSYRGAYSAHPAVSLGSSFSFRAVSSAKLPSGFSKILSCQDQTGAPGASKSTEVRNLNMDCSHLFAWTAIQTKKSFPSLLRNKTGLQSGRWGVSAISKGWLHSFEPLLNLDPIIFTSSAVRSPDPWNHAARKSPLERLTRLLPCTCCSCNGNISFSCRTSCSLGSICALPRKTIPRQNK